MATLRTSAVLDRPASAAPPAPPAPRTTPPHPPTAGPGTTPETTSRDPWLDNAKMALVTLVVVGHSWDLLPHTTLGGWVRDFLYAWHIPAFVMITGYLSRRFAWTPVKLATLVRTVAVPYLIFEAVLAWFRYEVGGVRLPHLFTDPHWPLWYLAALFFWRLATPALRTVSAGAAMGIAIGLSLASGLWFGHLFDHARILGFLPFFVLGLRFGDLNWSRLRRARMSVGLAGLGMVAILAWFARGWFASEWYYYRSPYDEMGAGPLDGPVIRLAVLGLGLLGAISFLMLVPRTRTWFTRLGSATLIVYLFHAFFVLYARYHGYPDWTAQHPLTAFAVTTAAGLGVALLLASPPVARVLAFAVDPIGRLTRFARSS